MFLWDGGLIQTEICRKKNKSCHVGSVQQITLDEGDIYTVGDDGCVRVWSRTGMLRSQLAALPLPVYALAWGSDGDKVAFSSGKDVVIKPLQPGDVPDTMADVDALERDTGYRPSTTVETGVARFIEWYRKYYGT